jgi:hypothetical protein
MKNVGVLKMLGKCSSRCQLQMWSLLGCHHLRTCEMQARAKGTGVILPNLQLEGMHPISVMFMGVNTCAGVVPLREGSYADEQVIEHGWDSGAFVGISWLMYANYGCIELESVQIDAILKNGHLDCHDIGICEMWARAEDTDMLF